MPRATVDKAGLNQNAVLPFELRLSDIENAMQDVYDFFHDVNTMLLAKGLQRLDDMTRPAAMSGMISDMITGSLARFSRSLVPNTHFNGHPDLVVRGRYPNNGVAEGADGVEIKSTRKEGGAVDTHGARDQWMCVFVYEVDLITEPAADRRPMQFTEVYLGQVVEGDFRRNKRNTDKGTRTATLHAQGITKLRGNWVYRTESMAQKERAERAAAREAARLVAREAKASAKSKTKKPIQAP
ncbi:MULTISPECIES: hypothetical protein [unclassified Rhizobium]|uniref:hypothetical protein n=1 Tax=unclassified Rhizobium TaxID=2613769 RepID=UPI0007F0B66F|nr:MULTISPECIES: hypothetical protein [unclassified Rhizobium]ANL11950.1 hypothetical protein AMJ98_PA00004 [Rhizobium sp. N1341]ANM42795.1 hypothetical protein AMK03_PA00004 [Rhizobium sp. N741]